MWEWQAVESGVGYICASKRQEHMDTPGGGREELAQGRPRPACRYDRPSGGGGGAAGESLDGPAFFYKCSDMLLT